MQVIINSKFIEAACQDLGYIDGDLIDVKIDSSWKFTEKVDWIKLCESVGEQDLHQITKIFFVNDEPKIIFTKASTAESLHRIYNSVWCMARPRLLFLETNAELIVLDLAQKPVINDVQLKDTALETVKDILNIKQQLKNYRREDIESGKTFEDEKFSDIEYRADLALIRDLKIVRGKLFDSGLSGPNLKYAHALIGKSIFIRYLEDRGILSQQYFQKIANDNPKWLKIITESNSKVYADERMKNLIYPKVLSDKSFTYALFKQIAEDFNGDIFPTDNSEEIIVTGNQLGIIKSFLDGDISHNNSLFFWAYRFDIIPIELISNIYEEFYHYSTRELEDNHRLLGVDNKGTYYTPIPLVEFLLRRVLTEVELAKKPIVLDPACGSGIFLVESFRRIVRYEQFSKKKKKLSRSELLTILQKQVRGIELNEEAVKIAAFSLYLAFLHYQTPPDILLQIEKGYRLPHLIYVENKRKEEKYFDLLLHSDAFNIEGKDKNVVNKFGQNSADIVVGNPPWGSPPDNDEAGREILTSIIEWCDKKGYPTSDKERSQAFMWRALDILKLGGQAGLFVSSGVLFKKSEKSNFFKQTFIDTTQVKEIVNFVHVRDVFFNGAISPFISIVFKKDVPKYGSYIDYWTARRTKIIENTKAVVLDKTDFKYFSYEEAVNSDIWKIFYFGNHRDLSLINKIRINDSLHKLEFIPKNEQPRRQGFIEGNKKSNSDWLKSYKELPAKCFDDRYSPIPFNKVLVDVPDRVKERGAKYIFEGKRILVGKVSQKTYPKGQLIARLETKKFSFRNTINCIKLNADHDEYYDIVLGILWSSLARYYFFLTSSKWGVWHDQIYLDEILSLPIALPKNSLLKNKISSVVTQLSNGEFAHFPEVNTQNLFSVFDQKNEKINFTKTQQQLELELDQYIYRLYKLSDAEIDLIKDRCTIDIDFFYKNSKSDAVAKLKNIQSLVGDIATISSPKASENSLNEYLHIFISLWNSELEKFKTLSYRIIYPSGSPLIAIVFDVKTAKKTPKPILDLELEWKKVLSDIDNYLPKKYSSKIYIDGMLRVVSISNNQIIIIKRNEMRLWTKTAAREDVDATMLQAMIQQENYDA